MPSEVVEYDISRLEFFLTVGAAVLLAGMILTYIWRYWE